jgi:hypothetical protein
VTALTIRKPDGAFWTEAPVEEAPIFGDTQQLGVYYITLRSATGERPAGSFAINLFSPSESAIDPTDRIVLGQTTVQEAGKADIGQRELWPWLVAFALTIMLIEWWVFFRGARLTRFSLSQIPFWRRRR